ncbi:hypothetical protein EDD21DRAFT_98651 [Dissophora ornata]|nr:hypothetical protein EDD21DRAFT_98651 [Dissophora ornata]
MRTEKGGGKREVGSTQYKQTIQSTNNIQLQDMPPPPSQVMPFFPFFCVLAGWQHPLVLGCFFFWWTNTQHPIQTHGQRHAHTHTHSCSLPPENTRHCHHQYHHRHQPSLKRLQHSITDAHLLMTVIGKTGSGAPKKNDMHTHSKDCTGSAQWGVYYVLRFLCL